MKFLSLFILIIFCGCATTKQPETFGVIDMEEVYVAVNVYPMSGCHVSDQSYALPTKKWVEKDFYFLLKQRFAHKRWVKESGDCDDYVLNAEAFIKETTWFNGQHALAIGRFCFVQFTGTGHAVLFFLYKEGNEVKIGFIEPQTGQIINLTEEEIQSCFHWSI